MASDQSIHEVSVENDDLPPTLARRPQHHLSFAKNLDYEQMAPAAYLYQSAVMELTTALSRMLPVTI
jgi:hypothetical protein